MKALKCKPSAQFTYNYSFEQVQQKKFTSTLIFEGRHIGSPKVDTSIFKDRRQKHCTDNVTEYRPQRRSIVLYLKILCSIISDEITTPLTYVYICSNVINVSTPRVTPHVHWLCIERLFTGFCPRWSTMVAIL